MKSKILYVAFVCTLLLVTNARAQEGVTPAEARAIAKDAYIFCFPLNYSPIDRYAIGDRTEGLKYDLDGSLTIYVQRDSPGKEKESNWLPAPNGPMQIAARMYGPKEPILKGEWKFPDPVKEQ